MSCFYFCALFCFCHSTSEYFLLHERSLYLHLCLSFYLQKLNLKQTLASCIFYFFLYRLPSPNPIYTYICVVTYLLTPSGYNYTSLSLTNELAEVQGVVSQSLCCRFAVCFFPMDLWYKILVHCICVYCIEIILHCFNRSFICN